MKRREAISPMDMLENKDLKPPYGVSAQQNADTTPLLAQFAGNLLLIRKTKKSIIMLVKTNPPEVI